MPRRAPASSRMVASCTPTLVKRLLGVQNPTRGAKVNSGVDTRRMIEVCVANLTDSIAGAMFLFFVFFLLRALLRRQWLAAVVAVLPFVGLDNGDHPLINGPILAVEIGLAILILIRFGVLPLIVGVFVGSTLFVLPLTTDFSTWYAGSTLFVLASTLVLTVVAFHMAIAGRALFKEGFLEAT